MPVESFQNGSVFDGNGIIIWVPTIANPAAPKVSELNAATAKRITYGLAADGFVLTPTTQKVNIERYSARQSVTKTGRKAYALVLKWVYNRQTPTDVETLLGTPGVKGFFVQLLGYPNDHTIAAGTKVNYVVPVELVKSDDVPGATNTEVMKTMEPDIIGEVQSEVAVVA